MMSLSAVNSPGALSVVLIRALTAILARVASTWVIVILSCCYYNLRLAVGAGEASLALTLY
jgi:hypothetical protein